MRHDVNDFESSVVAQELAIRGAIYGFCEFILGRLSLSSLILTASLVAV